MTTIERTLGKVKWFDSRGGFGFITILKGEENEGKDIFVHYSSLATVNSQYKYLVLGEYVEFVLAKAENEKYEYFAKDVTGIRGDNLMCESRRLSSLESRPLEHEPRPPRVEHEPRPPRVETKRVPSSRGGGRRDVVDKKTYSSVSAPNV